MSRVRAVDDVDEFARVAGDPEDVAASVSALWGSGESRPEWCFVLEDGGVDVGRVGFRVAPTVSDPSWLGSLPAEELFVFGLHLPWDGDHTAAGRRLLVDAVAAIAGDVPEMLEVRINDSLHPRPVSQRRLMGALGMDLFQEKDGFSWEDDGRPVASSDRLEFRSVAEIGIEAFRSVMTTGGADTLDRNDRYYWSGCGPENWAAQMSEYLIEGDERMWLVGYRDGEPVGYVAIVSDDEWEGTIGHIGVVPDHRGNGYIHDLLAAGAVAARQAGITRMLSDVDVLNHPMMRAMERAGHRRDPERWHVSVFRSTTLDLVAQ